MADAVPAAPTKSKAEIKAEEKAQRDASKQVANGVTRPRPNTSTGRIWDISDEVSKLTSKPAERKDVIARAVAEGLNPATAATQYGRWRKFFGLKAEPKAEKAPAVPKGSDVQTQVSPA